MKEFAIQSNACLVCGHRFDAATNPWTNRAPHPGDAAMCIECGTFHIVTDDMGLRPPTAVEQRRLDRDSKAQRMVTAHRELKGRRDDRLH